MQARTAFPLLVLMPLWAVDTPTRQIPVQITHEKGSFTGQLSVAVSGTMNKARAEWAGEIRNTSLGKIFRVTFCVHGFNPAGQQIKPGGNECIITLWGTNWQAGTALRFKGKQDIKISEDKVRCEVAKFAISVSEIFDHTPNLRTVDARCPLVWSSALRVFAERNFRPTLLDKGSFTATYAYDGGRVDKGSTNFLRAYTTADTGWTMTWESFRVDSASLYLREDSAGTCTAEVRMSFAGFGKPMFGQYGWYALESNFNFEKTLLDDLGARSVRATSEDLDNAITQLPTEAPKVEQSAAMPQLKITSDPTGAEIEIDGEFIGNTPTTVAAKLGKVTVRVKKAGFEPWERTLTLHPSDKRTLNAEMVKQ